MTTHSHPARRARLLRVLLAAAVGLVALSATHAHAAATITSGTCTPNGAAEGATGPCTTGSTLHLTGTELDSGMTVTFGSTPEQQAAITCPTPTVNDEKTTLTCTVTYTAGAVADGEYPVTLTLAGTQTSAGNVVFGTFLQQTIAGWNQNTPVPPYYLVSSVSSTWPSTGDSWTIYGSFNTAVPYKVLFYNTEPEIVDGNSGKTPVCDVTTVTVNSLTCSITVDVGVMGMWKFLVQDTISNSFVSMSPALRSIAVNPPPPSVTAASGDCAQDSTKCVTGAELTLTGSNFNLRDKAYNVITVGNGTAAGVSLNCSVTSVTATTLQCGLSGDAGLAPGAYPVYMTVQVCDMGMMSPKQQVGTLVIGTFLQQVIPGWSKATAADAVYSAVGVSSTWPSTGDKWTIYGNFNKAASYKVIFYNTEEGVVAGNAGKTPACEITTVTTNALTCTITVDNGVMGMWNVLVEDTATGAYVSGTTTLSSIAVNPQLPTVTGATGDCAQDSSKCVTDAELTLTGSNFNTRSPSYNKVTVGSADSGSSCAVTKVDATSLTCTLNIKGGSDLQSLPLYVQVQVCDMVMMSPQAPVGALLLHGGGGSAGWSSTTTCGSVPEPTIIERMSKNGAAIAFAVIFALAFFAVLVMLIIMCVRGGNLLKPSWRESQRGGAGAPGEYWNADQPMGPLPTVQDESSSAVGAAATGPGARYAI